MTSETYSRYLEQYACLKKRFGSPVRDAVHLIGICGVGMAALAFHLKRLGYNVTGCDKSSNSAIAKWLAEQGITVFEGHCKEHIEGVDWVVISSAISENNPELIAAIAKNKLYYKRGVVLAALASGNKTIAVCGSHGKTTTTAMITSILIEAKVQTAFCIGGEFNKPGCVAGVIEKKGNDTYFVLEADESDSTLALYEPDIAVLTNLEFDHAETFKSLDDLKSCFATMLGKVKGKIIYNADDPLLLELCENNPKAVSFGISNRACWQITGISEKRNGVSFCLVQNAVEKQIIDLKINVAGLHNVKNAAAAAVAGFLVGVDAGYIKNALLKFSPVKRRFESLFAGKGLRIISDYAHHPTEIRCFLSAALKLPHKKAVAIFQPHRYSRTRALLTDFVEAFRGIDELILLPVYSASEKPLEGGNSEDLYEKMRAAGLYDIKFVSSLESAMFYAGVNVFKHDLVLVVGAGDVDNAARELAHKLQTGWFKEYEEKLETLSREANLLEDECTIRRSYSLAQKTTLQVGGEAGIYIEVSTLRALLQIMSLLFKLKIPYVMLGGGSNIFFADTGFSGAVLRLAGEFSSLKWLDDSRIFVGAAIPLAQLLNEMIEAKKAGFEFLTGIPGTVGGAIYGNAGAFGNCIANYLESVKVLQPPDNCCELKHKELKFGYRAAHSLKGKIVLGAVLRASKTFNESDAMKLKEYQNKKSWLKGKRTAGSVFKNPVDVAAGYLLEQCGFKGYIVGGAKVSEEHANIIENTGCATASDIIVLMNQMREKVYRRFNIRLESEVIYVE